MNPIDHSIEIWSLYLPDHREETAACRDLLDGDELDRAGKFIASSDAERFILCRGLLRKLLAGRLQTDPATLRFSRTPNGKPFLENSLLEFNVSHSRDRLLIAMTQGRAVGVDIEFRRDGLSLHAIAKRWFSPEENAFFTAAEHPQRAFFEIWSKKEAYVKALGTGVYKALNTFSVPSGGESLMPGSGGEPRWFFKILEIDPGYAAAVVSEAPACPVRLRNF
jgi:4'-phosphopantetheinyl transferase